MRVGTYRLLFEIRGQAVYIQVFGTARETRYRAGGGYPLPRQNGRLDPMGAPRLPLPAEKIAEFCRRHRIQKLSLFGSVLRDDFRPDSDIDVLVEFEPGARTGVAFFGMEIELSALLGRKVDLNTEGFLSKYFRDRVLKEAEVQYDAT
jgi:predicted nucleotidyltransferase